MRQRIGDRDLEYTWLTAAGHVVSKRGTGQPGRPFVDAAGVHRFSWEILVPATPNNQLADWSGTYAPDVPPGTVRLALFKWDRPVNDPASVAFTTGNLAIDDVRVWGGTAGVVTNAAQPSSAGNGDIELALRASPDKSGNANQFDWVWHYVGPVLDASSWNRYDGAASTILPFLLGERGKGLYFEVKNSTGAQLNAGRLRVTCLAYEI